VYGLSLAGAANEVYGGGGADEEAAAGGACSTQKTVDPTGLRQAVQSGFPQVRQKDATGTSGWMAHIIVVVGLMSILS
jgi:hypothetical protein